MCSRVGARAYAQGACPPSRARRARARRAGVSGETRPGRRNPSQRSPKGNPCERRASWDSRQVHHERASSRTRRQPCLEDAGRALGAVGAAALSRAETSLPITLVGRDWSLSPFLWHQARTEMQRLSRMGVTVRPAREAVEVGAVRWARAFSPTPTCRQRLAAGPRKRSAHGEEQGGSARSRPTSPVHLTEPLYHRPGRSAAGQERHGGIAPDPS